MIMHKSRSPALKINARLFAAIGLAVVASTQAVAQADTRSRREVVDANVYPWSSIGKIGNSVGGQCTGAVIGANQVPTAAHCLYYKAVRRLLPAEAIHLRRPMTRLWKIERVQMIGSFSTSVSAASIKAFLVASARSRAPEENVR